MPLALTGRAGMVWLQAESTRHAPLVSGALPSTGVAAGHLAMSPDVLYKTHVAWSGWLHCCLWQIATHMHACMSALHVSLPVAAG